MLVLWLIARGQSRKVLATPIFIFGSKTTAAPNKPDCHTNVQKEAAWIIIRATQETQILETIVQTSTLTARSVAVQRVHPLPTCFGPRPVTRFKTTHHTMVTHFVSTLPGNCYCSDGTRGGTQPYPSSCQRIV